MAILSKPLPPRRILVLLASILLLRSAFVSGPKFLLNKLNAVAHGEPLTPQELSQALQQIFVKGEHGTNVLLVPYKDAYISKVCLGLIAAITTHIPSGPNTSNSPQQATSQRTLLSTALRKVKDQTQHRRLIRQATPCHPLPHRVHFVEIKGELHRRPAFLLSGLEDCFEYWSGEAGRKDC